MISQFNGEWDLQHGPLDETVFNQLPENNWTLLVQSLDYFHQPLHALIKACDFMPRWRLDDVMVSFASDNGGVGPHLDQYDVFLIQGSGKRRWRVGYKNQAIVKQNPHPEIAQIKPFDAELDIQVEAGDLLYIPPNTPHWGESIGDSICYSIGFRAPNLEAITQQLLKESAESLNQLWSDKNLLKPSQASGAISSELSQWASSEIQKLAQTQSLTIAAGKEVTGLKYPELLEEFSQCEADELAEVAFFKSFKLSSISRLAFYQEGKTLMVFANGEYLATSLQNLVLLETLNSYQTISAESFAKDRNLTRNLMSWLILVGAVEFID